VHDKPAGALKDRVMFFVRISTFLLMARCGGFMQSCEPENLVAAE
jgi:hypothetical protein